MITARRLVFAPRITSLATGALVVLVAMAAALLGATSDWVVQPLVETAQSHPTMATVVGFGIFGLVVAFFAPFMGQGDQIEGL